MIKIIISIIAIILISVFLYVLYHVYDYIFGERRESSAKKEHRGYSYGGYAKEINSVIESFDGKKENVKIKSYDGLTLSGVYYEMNPEAPTAIFFHGYRSNAVVDGCGFFAWCKKRGYNILMPDQRAHGKSGGKTITFGIRERRDCLSWVQYVNQRFGENKKIILMGLSMGASTVMMAMGLKLPENVVGVVADCGYSSPKEIISRVIGNMNLKVSSTFRFSAISAFVFGHFNIYETSATESASKSKIPLLIIHGGDDDYVPPEMAWEISSHAGNSAGTFIFDGARHGRSIYVDTKRYFEVIDEFLKKLL